MPQQPRQPVNLIELAKFEATEDVEYRINATNLLWLMPIWRWVEAEGRWNNAVGFYDLCMSEDGKYYHFYSRMPGKNLFAYRYVSTFFAAGALREYTVCPR